MILDCLKGMLDLALRLAGLLQKLLESKFGFQVDLLGLADQTSLDENDGCHVSDMKAPILGIVEVGNVLFQVLVKKNSTK